MSSKSVKQERLTRALRNSVKHGCPTRVPPQCVKSGCLTSEFVGNVTNKYCLCLSTYVSAFGLVGFILFSVVWISTLKGSFVVLYLGHRETQWKNQLKMFESWHDQFELISGKSAVRSSRLENVTLQWHSLWLKRMTYISALKLLATQEVLGDATTKPPKPPWKVKLMVLCQVMSALLLVQFSTLGSLAWNSLLPFLIFPCYLILNVYLNMCGKGFSVKTMKIDARVICLSMLVPLEFSGFGLCRRQRSAVGVAAGMFLLQGICLAFLCWTFGEHIFTYPLRNGFWSISGMDVLLILSMLLPSAAWVLLAFLYLMDGIGSAFSGQPALLAVGENAELRKAIRARTEALQKQMENGKLLKKTFWNTRMIEMKLVFFVLDVVSDVYSIVILILTADKLPGVGGDHPLHIHQEEIKYIKFSLALIQSIVLMASIFLQLRRTSVLVICSEVQQSWQAGLLSDKVFQALLQEKTFEAPFALFLQCFGFAFTVSFQNRNEFFGFSFSIALSLTGIMEGLYTSCHLCLDDAFKDDVLKQSTAVEEGRLPPPGQPVLPPPPGLPLAPIQLGTHGIRDTE